MHLIDSHCHVVLGDYTPRQKTVDFLDSYVHGGITSVVSAGEGNRYGHLAPETLERLDGQPVFRTDLQGDVQITTDGHKLWIYRPLDNQVMTGNERRKL